MTHSLPTVLILGRNAVGTIAASDGMRYYLTDCCAASATGSWDDQADEGIVACRACYRRIPDALGGIPEQSGPVPVPFGDGISYQAYTDLIAAGVLTTAGA